MSDPVKQRGVQYVVAISVLLAGYTACGAVVRDFDRYEIILNRRPFGDVPSDAELAAAAAPVAPAGPSFVDSLKMCAITSGGGALRVGFLDTKTTPPRTYFLFVGESEDGIEVVSADYDAETALLRKGGEERMLAMTLATSTAAPPQSPRDRFTSTGYKVVGGAIISPGRQLRMEERKRRSLELPALHGQVLEKHLREYNMEVIRQGAPPLPIPLTAEEDATLVAEGVLPPPAP